MKLRLVSGGTKRVLVIWKNALGPDHPDVATSLENYAAVLRKTGRTTEAKNVEVEPRRSGRGTSRRIQVGDVVIPSLTSLSG